MQQKKKVPNDDEYQHLENIWKYQTLRHVYIIMKSAKRWEISSCKHRHGNTWKMSSVKKCRHAEQL